MNEVDITALFCALLVGSAAEAGHGFVNQGENRRIRTDCETETHVIEVGLDQTPRARDSLHQALFASELTGKVPMVVIVDRDGREGRYEQEMRLVSARAGVAYLSCSKDFIIRWRSTQPLRASAVHLGEPDFPPRELARKFCNLEGVYRGGGS